VVLIKAPGHTPGSQVVYVRLASGKEYLLIGDIAWAMAGVQQRRQKPPSESKKMLEDRASLARELEWIHSVMTDTSITVVNGHDVQWIDGLIQAGSLKEGLELAVGG